MRPLTSLCWAQWPKRKQKSWPGWGWQAFLRQYKDFIQILLLGTAVINQVIVGGWGATLVLVGLTVLNAVMGFNQEAKAADSLATPEKMMKNIARVRRDGQAIEIDAEELVPGDIFPSPAKTVTASPAKGTARPVNGN